MNKSYEFSIWSRILICNAINLAHPGSRVYVFPIFSSYYRSKYREEMDKLQICNSELFLVFGRVSQTRHLLYLHFFFIFIYIYSLLFILSFQRHPCLSASCSSLYFINNFLVHSLFQFQFFQNTFLILIQLQLCFCRFFFP